MNFTKRQQTANRKKWIKALRSGEYRQTTGYLHRIDNNGKEGFCCLGVACDLAIKNGVVVSKKEEEKHYPHYFTYNDTASVLPKIVQEWLGLSNPEGCIDDNKSLASLNDLGKTFKQIAVIIERNTKKLTQYHVEGL